MNRRAFGFDLGDTLVHYRGYPSRLAPALPHGPGGRRGRLRHGGQRGGAGGGGGWGKDSRAGPANSG